MKLASLRDGSRDGQLAVVSRDLSTAHFATGIATRLQQVLDDWNFLSPQLEDLYATLNGGKARHAFAFDPRQCMAPLPRAYQWTSASASFDPVEPARQAEVPGSFCAEPLMVRGGSDHLLGPTDDALFADEAGGIDFGAEVAVITGDVPMGASPEAALDGVRLLLLANDWSLCKRIPAELAKGIDWLQSQPATAFSPVAVTPDDLGDAWVGGRVHLVLESHWNGRRVGRCDAADGMRFHFGQLIAHLAKTRPVRAGSIVGSGRPGNEDRQRGFAGVAEQRATETLETIESGVPRTDFLRFGDTIRITMAGRDGSSVFGAIEQTVRPAA